MKIHIITIFPESFDSYFSSSMMKNAISEGLFSLEFYKLNDFSDDKNKRVDFKSYGSHGQVIGAEPLGKTINHIFTKLGKKIPVVYMTPRGKLLNQKKVEKYYQKLFPEFIIICGHYEGIDERIIDLYVDEMLSIGNYVLSSGELAASVFIDAIVRNIPLVLGNPLSLQEESFSEKLNGKKEYPIYTKPKIFEGRKVPDVLLSGNHKEIEKWKFDNLT